MLSSFAQIKNLKKNNFKTLSSSLLFYSHFFLIAKNEDPVRIEENMLKIR
jgi:hypothetical protein